MKKSVIILIIVLLICAIGFLAFKTFYTPSDITVSGDVSTTNPKEEEVAQELAKKVKVESVSVKNKTDNIHIDNIYPSIVSFSNKEFENYINRTIANNIADYRKEITYVVDDLTPAVALYEYTTTYERYNWGDYLTLIVNQDYQTGGIRSNTWKDIYNINARTERIFYLDEIFEPTTDYETAIIEEIKKQADAAGYVLLGGEELTVLPKTQKFYIKDGTLFIYYDPSEIAAAKYGELNFEMPFKINAERIF